MAQSAALDPGDEPPVQGQEAERLWAYISKHPEGALMLAAL